jgi:hypothetical protein
MKWQIITVYYDQKILNITAQNETCSETTHEEREKIILHYYDQEILNITAHCATCSQITHEEVSIWIFINKINFPC